MEKLNCWEYFKCGREPGGSEVSRKGVCTACEATEFDGINNGHNGGRICWAVTGTLCPGEIDGLKAKDITSCMRCDFFHQVDKQERQPDFIVIPPKR